MNEVNQQNENFVIRDYHKYELGELYGHHWTTLRTWINYADEEILKRMNKFAKVVPASIVEKIVDTIGEPSKKTISS
jgi:hypothetical protein